MGEKPKSIWKRSWNLPGSFLGWLVLVTFIALGISLLTAVIIDGVRMEEDLGIIAVVTAVAVAGALIFLFIRWLCCWRNFKRFLFCLASFATLIALFYAEEDWRGRHDWEKFKREWEAKGERFDWQSILPPPVPDDQNFAFSPVWIAEDKYVFQNTIERAKAWYGDRIYSNEVAKIFPLLPVSTSTVVGTNMWSFPSSPGNSGNWTSSRFSDLKPWQLYYRNLGKTNPAAGIIIAPQAQSPAQDVLLALGKFDPVIEQLRQDSARPDSRFPIGYDMQPPAAILLPHLAAEKRYAQVLQLRALAELQNGESEKALADVKLMLRLVDASRTEPFLISHLVRIAILQIALQSVWEGLAEHKWSDAQLADLEVELAKLDFLADYQFTIRGERNLVIANIDFFRHPTQSPEFKRPRLYFIAPFFYLMQELYNLSGPGGDENSPIGFQMLVLGFGPSGWLDQNELRIARFETKWYLPVVDPEAQTISSAKIRAAGNALDEELRHRTPENLLETLFMPALGGGARKFAYAQSSVNLARAAIALERYRLAHGEFPESLDALAPKFIAQVPHDVIGGQPLKYRRTDDGLFVMYSVGWNETDDGGVVGLTTDGKNTDYLKGDWVWRYPKKE
jgi:hypothetical protein